MICVRAHKVTAMGPNSVNRGEDGRGKDIVLGGKTRDRWSTQALVNRIRKDFFEGEFERCNNSRWWHEEIAKTAAAELHVPYTEVLVSAEAIFNLLNLREAKEEPKEDAATPTAEVETEATEEGDSAKGVLLRLSEGERAWLLRKTIEYHKCEEKPAKKKDGEYAFKPSFGKAKKEMALEFMGVYDNDRKGEIAAFGRFFASLDNMKVNGAFSFAHTIGTSESENDADDFTAVDDLRPNVGAAHMGSTAISASPMFSEMSCNFNLLVDNLKGNVKEALNVLGKVLKGFALTVPGGKQHSMFSKPLPEYVCIEILDTELSMADAFYMPVRPTEKESSAVKSVKQLVKVRNAKYSTYGIVCHERAEVCPLSEDYDGLFQGKTVTLAGAIERIVSRIPSLLPS